MCQFHRVHSRPASNGSPPRKPSGKKSKPPVPAPCTQLQSSSSSDSPTSLNSEQSFLAFFAGPSGASADTTIIKAQQHLQPDARFSKQDVKQLKAQPATNTPSHLPPTQSQSPNNTPRATGKKPIAPAFVIAACPAFLSPPPRPDQLPMPPSLLLRKAALRSADNAVAASVSPASVPTSPLHSGLCDWPAPSLLHIVPSVQA